MATIYFHEIQAYREELATLVRRFEELGHPNPDVNLTHASLLWVTLSPMIRNFRHKGLAKFFKSGSTAGIRAAHAKRLPLILGRLNAALVIKDMNLPGLRLHKLTGNRQGT